MEVIISAEGRYWLLDSCFRRNDVGGIERSGVNLFVVATPECSSKKDFAYWIPAFAGMTLEALIALA
ncbi:MAG: hypothetical protein R3337_07560 [Gammaproteobacteria bacterium]|nr:hypothetical protein [Gammaproteobacteria bacterium]